MKPSLQTAFKSWIVFTALVIISIVVIYIRNGAAGLDLFIQQWPLSNLAVTLASTALTWLCFGLLLYLLANEKINSVSAFTMVGFFIVMFVTLNILRERFRYGDYAYYIEAATAMLQHKALPVTYLYPPLWAAILQFIVPLGDQGVLTVLWTTNVIALAAFYFLLHRLLERYGFSVRFAALVTVIFILINVPLQRTLGYVQVNLMVIDLILLSVFTYPKNLFLSALTLALAVHLKTSPAVLVLAFLLERDWRWLAWFALTFIIIGLFPVVTNGISPYLDYLHNTVALAQRPNTNFHDTSFDSFLRFFNPFLGISAFWTGIMITVSKAVLALAVFGVMIKNIRSRTFFNDQVRGDVILNSIPPLFILMTLASPIVWEHHAIFVTLSFLLMLKRIEAPAAWTWFGFAYMFEFIMPSFDFFPWSYGRLIAPLIVLVLMWGLPKKQGGSPFFYTVNMWFERLRFKTS